MYRQFAQVYDLLMKDVDYEGWTAYIEDLFSYYDARPKNIIDLACGTGNITIPLAKKGYQMTGIDISHDMLSMADQKGVALSLPIRWICQDIRKMTGFHERDAILCACDGLNYILNREDLRKIFEKVYQALGRNGIFAFDINSRYKIQQILADRTFAYAGEEVSYIWDNYFDPEQDIIDYELSFFMKQGEHYIRFNEIHHQRAYYLEEILGFLEDVGFKKIHSFEAFTFEPIRSTSERLQFIAEK